MKVLFICVANSARSQMAEALAQKLFPKHSFYSAGSQPTKPNIFAIKVLALIGIDWSMAKSNNISDFKLDEFDYIIALCKEEQCPVILSNKAQILQWPMPDPAFMGNTDDEKLNSFLEVREQIQKSLKNSNLFD